jgi:hypothetical protein
MAGCRGNSSLDKLRVLFAALTLVVITETATCETAAINNQSKRQDKTRDLRQYWTLAKTGGPNLRF